MIKKKKKKTLFIIWRPPNPMAPWNSKLRPWKTELPVKEHSTNWATNWVALFREVLKLNKRTELATLIRSTYNEQLKQFHSSSHLSAILICCQLVEAAIGTRKRRRRNLIPSVARFLFPLSLSLSLSPLTANCAQGKFKKSFRQKETSCREEDKGKRFWFQPAVKKCSSCLRT